MYRDGMYGELTYSVWRWDTRRTEDYVHTDELRFRNPRDLERRLKEDEIVRVDEIVRCQEDLRQLNLEQARYQRVRGPVLRGRRPQRAARAWKQTRAQSVEVNTQIPVRENRPENRAMSVPPAEVNWAAFLAEFAKVTCRGDNPPEDNDGIEFKEQIPLVETGMYGRQGDARGQDEEYVERNERSVLGRKGDLDHRDIIADVNRGGDNVADCIEYANNERTYIPYQDTYINDRQVNDRHVTYEMNLKDQMYRQGIKLNFVLPPGTGIQHGGNM